MKASYCFSYRKLRFTGFHTAKIQGKPLKKKTLKLNVNVQMKWKAYTFSRFN